MALPFSLQLRLLKPWSSVTAETPIAIQQDTGDLTEAVLVAADPADAILREQAFAVQDLDERARILYAVPSIRKHCSIAVDRSSGQNKPLTIDFLPPEIRHSKRSEKPWLANNFGFGNAKRDALVYDVAVGQQGIEDILVYRRTVVSVGVHSHAPGHHIAAAVRAAQLREQVSPPAESFFVENPVEYVRQRFGLVTPERALSWLDRMAWRISAELLDREDIPCFRTTYDRKPRPHYPEQDKTSVVSMTAPLRDDADKVALHQLFGIFGYDVLPVQDIQLVTQALNPERKPRQARTRVYVNRGRQLHFPQYAVDIR